MTLNETFASAEEKIHEAVDSGRTRLRAVVDDAEKRIEEGLPRVRKQLDAWRERSFEDAERIGGYVTDALTWVSGRLPKLDTPFRNPLPEPEEVVTRWFETSIRVLDLQRKLALDWIAALRSSDPV